MNFIELNRNIRELENGSWRLTAFEDLQVQYCEERLYALRCKLGTPNEHICLIRERSEDAAIARAVFDLHKRGEIDARIKTLCDKIVIAKIALTNLQARFVSSVYDGTIDSHEALRITENALAAIRELESVKTKPIRNCDRFETAEDAYNACPQFCDIDVKTMTERELKILEATTKCLEWLFAPIAEKGDAK